MQIVDASILIEALKDLKITPDDNGSDGPDTTLRRDSEKLPEKGTPVDASIDMLGNLAVVSFATQTKAYYALYASSDMISWKSVGAAMGNGNPAAVGHTPNEDESYFVVIKVVPSDRAIEVDTQIKK